MNKELTKIEPARAWAIVGPTKNGFSIFCHTIERTRTESIKSFISVWLPNLPVSKWRWWERRGYKSVRVIVKVEADETSHIHETKCQTR